LSGGQYDQEEYHPRVETLREMGSDIRRERDDVADSSEIKLDLNVRPILSVCKRKRLSVEALVHIGEIALGTVT
jgi:hypothetical protein